MLNRYALTLTLLMMNSVPVVAQHKITITRVESLRAVPTDKVARNQLELIPGTVEAPADAKPMRPIPEITYSYRGSSNIPLPTPNPLGVSFCDMDIYPFEE